MTTSTLEQIEADIAHLSLPEQLWLIERLAYRIGRQALPPLHVDEQALAEMSADPAIQQELQQIDNEFRVTEMDWILTDDYPARRYLFCQS